MTPRCRLGKGPPGNGNGNVPVREQTDDDGEQSSKLQKDLSMTDTFSRSKTNEVSTRAVTGVAFAGQMLDMKSFMASNMHTISLPNEQTMQKITKIPKTKVGYDLKSLASLYGFAESELQSFGQLFGAAWR
eukprot:Skav204973  [mRNA]  locus=scaffold1180:87915:97997:- [translate_table: standard]